MTPSDAAQVVRTLAADAGLNRVGIARAGRVGRADYLRGWLDAGLAGRMDYLHRYFEQRVNPRELLPGARSVIVAALNYHQRSPPRPVDEATGRVAMYAWGDDYHLVLRDRLRKLVEGLRARVAQPLDARICVDTAPILEREWAAAAGVGWIGKNTLVLHQSLGSYFFLGEIVTSLELATDPPATDHCGSCRRCLDACPTDAFPAPYQMDASRCISYLTIELREQIPEEFHGDMGDWVFGCDICQQVCPYNAKAPTTRDFPVRSPGPFPGLAELAEWTPEDYRSALKGSAAKRAKLPMLHRNARIALANAQGKRR